MEGGAEYLTRQVIGEQLAGDPDFAINFTTYADEVNYLWRMGPRVLASFPVIYFQGRIDMLPPAP